MTEKLGAASEATTNGGRLVFYVFGAVAEFERERFASAPRRPRGPAAGSSADEP